MKPRGVVLKSRRELKLMREAGRINALALAAAAAVVRPGATTSDINEAAAGVLRQHGARPAFLGYGHPPFPAVTTVSVNEELVHGIPGRRRLAEGDIVSIDVGAVVDGFVGDSALTIGVGEISLEAQRLIDAALDALFAGIGQMVAGRRSGDVSAAIQSLVESRGFNVVREYTGHGVGRAMHEDPQVPNYGAPHQGMLLRPGMTIALEPMVLGGDPRTRLLADGWTVVSLDGGLTAHFEHTVAVTRGGPQVLTAVDVDSGLDGRYNEYFAGIAKPAEASRSVSV